MSYGTSRSSRVKLTATLLCSILFSVVAIRPPSVQADGLRDNNAEDVRRIPRAGIEVDAQTRQELEHELTQLSAMIDALRERDEPVISRHLPDVVIFSRAVHDALVHGEFFAEGDLDIARRLLQAGRQRAEQLAEKKNPWMRQRGLVVLGYVSRIDHSVQPYGLVIPPAWRRTQKDASRLDIWFHGRGETLSEVKFLGQRMQQTGAYTPRDTIVLHPYGRYSNAFKFAGEVDVLEALADVQRRYRIDEDRISVRGFSMGGAACWQFAVHYPDRWFAANPGAGFSETPEFLRFFQKETLNPTWYEKKLWHLYDCTDWARNLHHCPTVAYSGELDIQKQAADIMQQALRQEQLSLVHIIGPQTKHSIHPGAKRQIEARFDRLARPGRQRTPQRVRFTTYTLKYNRLGWVQINALGRHWSRASVDARIEAAGSIVVRVENVTDLALRFSPGEFPTEFAQRPPTVLFEDVNGDQVMRTTLAGSDLPLVRTDRSWACRFHREDGGWTRGAAPAGGLRKQHNLQGPIDDAFMDSFLFVEPTGTARSPLVQRWVEAELEHAVVHWRRHFRGDARVKKDTEVDDQEIASANLVLFGDPQSNRLLARLSEKLPLQWSADGIQVGKRRFDASHHAPILIYPNPLNPRRYVVLNSGFTFREYDYLNNARQVPKLPDWAIVDLNTPANSRYPGKIVAANFFGEHWELRPDDAR